MGRIGREWEKEGEKEGLKKNRYVIFSLFFLRVLRALRGALKA
jgi:hypothetical protein